MFTPKILFRLSLLAIVALVIALWRAQRDQRELGRARAAAETEARELRDRLTAAQRESRRFAEELLARKDTARDAGPPRGPAVDFGAVREEFIGPPKLAEMQRLHALHERAALDGRFAALFKALKLSPEKLERFKTLLVEREVAFGDVMAAAADKGIELPEPGAIERAVAQAQRDIDASVRTLLGDDAFADYERYRQTLGERTIVEQLRQRLSYSGEPLSDAQSAQLLQTLAAQQSTAAASAAPAGDAVFFGPAGATTALTGSPAISDAAVTQAQSFLTPQQLRALQDLQTAQRLQQEAMQQIGPPPGASGAARGATISIGVARPPGGK